MPNNRTPLALALAALLPLWALAQEAAPPAAPEPPGTAKNAAEPPATEAEQVLDAAAQKVRALQGVSADILQEVEMLGQRFTVEGQYARAPDHRLRLELTVKGLGDSTGSMLQTCDGQLRWDVYHVLETRTYHKLNLAKLLDRLRGPEFDDAFRENVLTQLGFAGPDALLTGLRKSVAFDQKEEGDFQGHPVWIVHGTWKDRQALIGDQPPPPMMQGPNLPPYVPSQVTAWVGRDDGWPYQVVLEGKVRSMLPEDRPKGPDGRPIAPPPPASQEKPSKIVLTYSNVQLNPELSPDLFTYQVPSNAQSQVVDETETRLNELEQAAQLLQASKAEGKTEEEPLIDQPIAVPRLSPEGSQPAVSPPQTEPAPR